LELKNNFVQNITSKIDYNLKKYENILSKNNFDLLIHQIIILITNMIENYIFKKKFTQLGGLQLDKYIRNFIIFFSSKSSKPIRELFSKLQQISLLLKLFKTSEVLEYW
jgi:hypothetical protein